MKKLAKRYLRIKKKKSSLLLKIALVVLAAYLLYAIVQIQLDVSRQKAQVSELQIESELLQSKINEQNRLMSNETEADYMERIAREQLGYTNAGERVYVDANAGGD